MLVINDVSCFSFYQRKGFKDQDYLIRFQCGLTRQWLMTGCLFWEQNNYECVILVVAEQCNSNNSLPIFLSVFFVFTLCVPSQIPRLTHQSILVEKSVVGIVQSWQVSVIFQLPSLRDQANHIVPHNQTCFLFIIQSILYSCCVSYFQFGSGLLILDLQYLYCLHQFQSAQKQ